jgi:hypothetical protein
MCCNGRSTADHAAVRFKALLCLLVLALQLALPVVHMWEVAAERSAAVSAVPSWPFLLEDWPHPTALSATDTVPVGPPHNPALCSVCQALHRLRDAVGTQVGIARVPTAGNWLVPLPAVYAHTPSLLASAPRAPPSLS